MNRIKIIKKPWGEERLFAHTKKYAGKILIIRKQHRLSFQYHKQKEETIYCAEGLLKITIESKNGRLENKTITSGQVIHIPPKTKHRFEALQNSRLIEISTSELDDVVRLKDDYGRVKEKK